MDNPLIVHISDISQVNSLVSVFPQKAKALAEAFWPGPLTIIMPCSDNVPTQVTAGLSTVAIRFPSHKTAQDIINYAEVPLAAPSANLSGSPRPTTATHVFNDLNGRIPLIIDGGKSKISFSYITACILTETLFSLNSVTIQFS